MGARAGGARACPGTPMAAPMWRIPMDTMSNAIAAACLFCMVAEGKEEENSEGGAKLSGLRCSSQAARDARHLHTRTRTHFRCIMSAKSWAVWCMCGVLASLLELQDKKLESHTLTADLAPACY